MNDMQQVPPKVRLVRDFVNTYEPQVDDESLATTADLWDWLVKQNLAPAETSVTDTDLATALAVREGLRNVLLHHAGHAADPDALDAFRLVLAELPVRFEFDNAGFQLVSARDDALSHALARLLDAVRETSQDGTWPRLKVCARDTCRWAFYDASRNSARRWCSMAGCGNHTKMQRAYAARRAHAAGAPA